MNMVERISEEVRSLPDFELQEVLDFVGFLKTRQGMTMLLASNDTVTDWNKLQQHSRDLITDPVKELDLALLDEVQGKVCTGATWTRDELYDRGLR